MSSPMTSPKSIEHYIASAKDTLAAMSRESDVMDDALNARIERSVAIISEIEQNNNEARRLGQSPSAADLSEMQSLSRTLVTLHAKVTHPQNRAFIAEISRLREHSPSAARDLNATLQDIPLGKRDVALSEHCNKLLDMLKVPSRSFQQRNITGITRSHPYTAYRHEDKMLNDFISSKKEELARISQYFSNKEGRSSEKDRLACNSLLTIQDDISAALDSLNSHQFGRVSEAIDNYRRDGQNYQADLIEKALHATPLKDRASMLSGPSLVKNALATNASGVVFADPRDNSLIDFTRAPAAYRSATGQQREDRGQINRLAPEAGLVSTAFNTYERLKTAAPTARVIASDTPMMSPLVSPSAASPSAASPSAASPSEASPSEASPSAASTTSMDDAESVSMSADESVETMFADVVEKVTTPAPNKTSQFKERLKAVEQSSSAAVELTPVEEIRRSHDATGDIIEEDLDNPHSGLDY